MDLFYIVKVLIIISAGFSYLNEMFVKLSGTIGVMAMSVVASVVALKAQCRRNLVFLKPVVNLNGLIQ